MAEALRCTTDTTAGGGHTGRKHEGRGPVRPPRGADRIGGRRVRRQAFEAVADQPMDDLDFDPRMSPHAYEAAPAAVGIIIVDHGCSEGGGGGTRGQLERLCAGAAADAGAEALGSCGRRTWAASPSISEAFPANCR